MLVAPGHKEAGPRLGSGLPLPSPASKPRELSPVLDHVSSTTPGSWCCQTCADKLGMLAADTKCRPISSRPPHASEISVRGGGLQE